MSSEIPFRTDDELLSAWLDGELPPDRAKSLEERLSTDAALAERLERLRRADVALRDAYASVADEPLPGRVLDLLHDELAARRSPRPLLAVSWPYALAASVTLAIGAALGYLMAPRDSTPEAGLLASIGAVSPASELHLALESTPSGQTRAIAAGLTATPVLSFRTSTGEICRQIDIAGARGSAEALACRSADGWQVDALGFLADAGRSGDRDGGVFRPAGRADSVVDVAIDERIAGEPLDAAAEAELIARSWANR